MKRINEYMEWHPNIPEREYSQVEKIELSCELCKEQGYKGMVLQEEGILPDGSFQEREWRICPKHRNCPTILKYRASLVPVEVLQRRSRMPDVLLKKDLKGFKKVYPYHDKMLHALKRWHDYEYGKWLVFAGPSGSGKTHLASSGVNRLIKDGRDVFYIDWFGLCNSYRTRYQEDFERAKRCDVLFLDDLYKGTCTPYQMQMCIELINSRYLEGKLTVITTEKTKADLLNLDTAIAGRILEMAQDCFYEVPKGSKNYRLEM